MDTTIQVRKRGTVTFPAGEFLLTIRSLLSTL